MKAKIKLLVVLLVTVLAAISSKNIAFASENTSAGQQTSPEAITDKADNETTKAATNNGNTDNMNGTADLTGNDQLPAKEGYDIYVDEQGQAYYIKKEPAKETAAVIKADDAKNGDLKKAGSKKNQIASANIKKLSYSQKDLRLLACLVYAEAGNQSYSGKLAVANVVLNRLNSKAYSHCKTIKEVIYDRKWATQFSVTIKSRRTGLSPLDKALKSYDTGKYNGDQEIEKKAMNSAIKAAKEALSGENNIGSFLCFNAGHRFMHRVKSRYDSYKIIGAHIFYRTK